MNRYWEKISLRSFCFSVALLVSLTAGREATAAQLTAIWGDTSSNEDGFKVERKTGTTGTFAQVGVTAVNTTTYLSTNLADGTTYCYRVRAYNSVGASVYSNEACGTTSSVPFTLTVTKSGAGQGTITSSSAGISCGSDCSESYTGTKTVTLSAAPVAGSAFSGWSGGSCSGTGSCTLIMNTNTNVTATFTTVTTPTTYPLMVTKTGTGSGTVSATGINCGADCSQAYANNTVVTLTPSAATGSTFASWSGDADCSDGSVTMNAAKTCTATFTTIAVGGDTTPPTAPSEFTATVVSSSQINLNWTAATDNVGVANYLVERCKGTGCTNFTQIATPSGTNWNNAGFKSSAGTTFRYRIRARDAAGYLGPYSSIATATFGSSSPAPTTGLVAAYSFGAGSGTTVQDSSGLNNTGTISGATWTTSGKFGKALSFDGIDDLVTVTDAPSLDLTTGMTLEAWVYPTVASTHWTTAVLKEQSGALVYSLYARTRTDLPGAYVFTENEFGVNGPTALPRNTWTHLAATYDGGTLRLYVNGVLKTSRTQTGTLRTSDGHLRIGGNKVWGDEYFQGRIDEVRIYNRALSATQIQTDMNTAVTP